MHYDLRRLKQLFQRTWSALLIEAVDDRRRALVACLSKARKKPSEKRIHNLRVATRRMQSTLALIETVIPAQRTRKLRRKLKKRLRDLSLIRDVQVQLGCCNELIANFPQLAGLQKFLLRREAGLQRRVTKELLSFGPGKLDIRTEKLLERLIGSMDPDSDDALGERIEASVEDAWRRVLFLRARVDPKQTKSIHRMRLAFKRFRYMAEIVAPSIPQFSPERLKAIRTYQDRMGLIQDVETLLRTMMQFRKESGRTSLLVVENELRRRRQHLIDSFMQSIDELRFFWSARQADSREVV